MVAGRKILLVSQYTYPIEGKAHLWLSLLGMGIFACEHCPVGDPLHGHLMQAICF